MHGPTFGLLIWSVVSAVVLIAIPVAIVVFARRLLRAVERRSVLEGRIAELGERVQRLESQYLDLADETARLREAERFTQRLLADRAALGAAPAPSAGSH